MKSKNTGIFLLISSIYWILRELYWTIERFAGESADYWGEHIGENLLLTVQIIVPISLLTLAINLIVTTPDLAKDGIVEPMEKNNATNVMSVGDWLINFLIIIIPLFGIISMVIWANDDKNKIRKNWAVASLIWMGLVFVLSILLYAAIFSVMI